MKLFTPISIGTLELPNRIVMPAMHLNFTMDGMMNDKFIEFYRLRVKGGCGLIQIGGCPTDSRAGAEFMVGINDDKYLPGMKRFTDMVHEEGGFTGCQLYHAGRYTYSFLLGGEPAYSASETISGLTREKSKAMTLDDIANSIQEFASCAARVKEAGFDAVEIIASAGYLVNQFFSPLTNLRDDEYGGSFENRARFGVEVVQAVRKAVGDFPITVRLSGNDFVKDSNTNKENARFAQLLEEAGAQMFNVTGGWHESRVPQITNALPRGGYSYLGRNVKRLVNVPVAAANRINQPELAERLLQEGWCDMVSLGRALITDPEWPNKAREERGEDIVQCISCNQECLDNIFQMRQLGCLMNPEVGHEDEAKTPLTEPKNVLVAGGGPAGLMAAAVAAKRGHKVTLVEKENRLGGQIYAASSAPNKDEFFRMIPVFKRQAELQGVTLETGVEVTKELLESRKPDVLVVATGSKPVVPPIEGAECDNVVFPLDVLENKVSVGENVVVIGGGATGVDTALFLAEVGTISPETAAFLIKHDAEKPEVIRELLWKGNKKITIVEMARKIGGGIGKSTKWIAMKEMKEMGVEAIASAKVTKIDDDGVHIEVGEETRVLPADTVVMAAGVAPFDPLADVVEGFGGEVVRVGDAGEVGNAAHAIRDAYRKLNTL